MIDTARKRESNRKWRLDNRERVNATKRRWTRLNLKIIRVYNRNWRLRNIEKAKEIRRRWELANPEKKWRTTNPEKAKTASMRRHRYKCYGLSDNDFQKLLKSQNNSCAVCLDLFTRTPQVDHNHKTGKVRGLLCRPCNMALGGFKDSPEICARATEYLRKC